jgi:hypothetical protein
VERTLTIDGKEVRFKSTGGTPLRYKAQFGRDFLADMMKLNALGRLNFDKLETDRFDLLDFDPYYYFVWALAKTADDSISDPITWLDQFESFPVIKIARELQDMLASSIQEKKN